jgi:hypothetical protein
MRSRLVRPTAAHALIASVILSGAVSSGRVCHADAPRQPQSAGAAPSTSNPDIGPWRLAMHLSGGFAGLDRQLELASTGELTAADRRRGTQVTARVTAEDIAQLAELIPAAPLPSTAPSGCADCLLYAVTIEAHGGSLAVALDDVSLGRSPVAPLVKRLNELLNQALTGRLKSPGMQ